MYETLMNKYGINQAGFYVEDAERAALEHSQLFGSGPFIVMPSVKPDKAYYRGTEVDLEMKLAYGHYDNIQIEMIQVLSAGQNHYTEAGRYGFHHFSIWSDDPDQVAKDFADAGFEVAFEMFSGGGLHVRYFDCRDPWGFYVEVHKPIKETWDQFAAMQQNWDGKDPVRVIGA